MVEENSDGGIDSIIRYGGVTGARLEADSFAFGQGLTIAKTYAHLMAPFMMAFEPAQPGQHHPAPWVAVEGGLSFDIESEIFLPPDFNPPRWFSRGGTIWWITTLLKLRATARLFTPVLSNASFSRANTPDVNVRIWPMEVYTHRIALAPGSNNVVSLEALEWIKRHWFDGGILALENHKFYLLVEALDKAAYAGSYSLALLLIWAALESLFGTGRDELRFRISTFIACFLEPVRNTRRQLQRKVAGLYDARSSVAHGRVLGELDPLHETYQLGRKVFLKIVEDNSVPDQDSLMGLLFGTG